MKVDAYTPSSAMMNGSSAAPAKQVENSSVETSINSAQTIKFPPDKVENAVKVANNILKMMDARFEYDYNKDIDQEIIRVVDNESNKTIRQFPPEEIVNMLEKMYDMLGIFVDKKA